MTASTWRALFSVADRIALEIEKVRGGPCCEGDVTLLAHIVSGDDKRREVNKKQSQET